MDILTAKSSSRSNLQKAIFANGVYSGASGLFLLLFSQSTAAFLGGVSPRIVAVTGLSLLIYAPLLFRIASTSPVRRSIAWAIIELDVLWVLASGVLVFSNLVALSTSGRWAIAIAADIVAFFAVVQYLGLRTENNQD